METVGTVTWSTGSNGRGRCWRHFPKGRGDVSGFLGEKKSCFNNKKTPWDFRRAQHRSRACLYCVQWIFLKNFQKLYFPFLPRFSITLEKMHLSAIKQSTINVANLIWLPMFWDKRRGFESAKVKKTPHILVSECMATKNRSWLPPSFIALKRWGAVHAAITCKRCAKPVQRKWLMK